MTRYISAVQKRNTAVLLRKPGRLASQYASIYTDRFQKDEIRTKKCLIFIENNYASPITIEDIAKSAGISISSCLRLFKVVLGTTPIQYLLKYRLQRICESLENDPETTISNVVFSNGFSDATYFNRCFKKEYGMTPTEYILKTIRLKE